MSHADEIREYAYKNFVKPAKHVGLDRFTIPAMAIHEGLRMNASFPNVCQALSKEKFWQTYGLKEPIVHGNNPSNTTIFEYTFASKTDVVVGAITRP